MIHHLILMGDHVSLSLKEGMVVDQEKKVALSVLGSVQCFSSHGRWSCQCLSALAEQCPTVLATWDNKTGKWRTCSVLPRCRYVNPEATALICRLTDKVATRYASDLLMTKVANQHTLIRSLSPDLPPLPKLAPNSFQRILRLEAKWAKFFWAMYFKVASEDLFVREKRQASAPLNVALNYGYAFLYHALEWQCVASGVEPGIGIIHRLRRSRPSLVCDLIEPLRCCVELTVMRNLDEMHDKKLMAGRFAEMMESSWSYQDRRFKLRTILRLMTESFVRSLRYPGRHQFHPFSLHARDACL
jgi:CRISPR/Cas system-associated endonuclease Cas1